MTRENRRDNASAELDRAERTLAAAEALAKLGMSDDAASRAYYAAFHAACALLLLAGKQARSHRGVEALLRRHYVAAGALDEDIVDSLSRLQEKRSIADYGRERRVPVDEVPALLDAARAVIAAARQQLAAFAEPEA